MIHQRFISTLLVIILICSKLYALELADSEINTTAIFKGEYACNSLLSNNGFESNLTDWNATNNGVTISGNAAVGTKAVLVSNTGTAAGLWQSITGSANEIYTLKVLAKKTSSARPYIGIEFFDASGTRIDDKFLEITSTTYQEFSFSAMTPNNATKVQVLLWNGKDTGEAFFDDICFEKFTVAPVSCANSVDILPDDGGVYVMDHSGNNSDTKDYDYGDIKLCDNGDGTLSIRGYVIGGNDSDWHESNAVPCGVQDAWYIDLVLSDVQSWEEFQGSYVQREGCAANRAEWDFWEVSGTYTGVGCNTGRVITVLSAAQNYRVQVGWGGNSHSCDFGMSTWFVGVENGTSTHSDMYFHIKEIDYETVRPPRRRNPGCQDNLLRNPGFEDSPTSSPPYWTVPTASTFSTSNNYKIKGDFSAHLYHNGSGTGQVYQKVTGIIPGNNYNLSFYAGTHETNYSHTVKIEFYNSSNTLLETSEVIEVDKDLDGNNTLDPYNLSTIAPPNTSYLRVVGTAEGDYLRLDEVCLTTDKNICDNSITNSDFNNGTTDWTFKTTGAARTRAELDIDDTNQLSGPISALITIDESANEVSDIQLLHDDLSILSGEEYQVNFQAKATADRPITVAIKKSSSPYTVYKSQIFDLTTNSDNFSFSYTPTIDNLGDVELVFELGGNKQEVYLDKISYSVNCNISCPEKLTNTQFDNGTTDWNLIVNSSNSVATLNIDNTNKLSGTNAAFVDITTAGPDSWNIQLIQSGKSIEVGKEYTLSFEAMALINRPIDASVQKATEDHRTYGSRILTITQEPQTYSFNFIASETNTDDVAIVFHVAEEAGSLFIDNVHFSEACGIEICDNNIDDDHDGLIDEEDPDCSISNACSNTGANLFTNPSFENGNWTGSETFLPGVSATPSSQLSNWETGSSKWIQTSKATDGNKILYINTDEEDTEVCIGQNYPLGSTEIINDCATYQVCLDWASFNQDHPTGRSARSQPALDIAFQDASGENITFASLPLGKATANQDWDNLVWSSTSLQFQLKGSLTPPTNATQIIIFLSEYKGAANGLLLDNTRLSITTDCIEICDNNKDDDGDNFIDSFDPDCSCTATGIPNIDFSKRPDGSPLTAGTIVSELWSPWGVHISTNNTALYPPMIFDSNNPTGGDTDLGTPNEDFGGPGRGNGGAAGSIGENKVSLGNLMIISEDGNTSVPDDRGDGGTIIYNFDFPVNISSIEVIDVDQGNPGTVKAYSANGALITQQSVQDYGNNSYQKIVLNAVNVSKLEVIVPTSFSVGTLLFCDDITPEDCTNGIDDDGDGFVDEADSDCTSICDSPTLIFQNPSLVGGAANAVGAVHEFSNVLPGIDAQIELIDKSHSEISILNMDLPASVTGGYDYAFQPEIDYNWLNADGSYDPYGQRWVEFELTFFESGTNTPLNIPLATISAIDIDGNGDGLKDFFETSNFDAYRLQSNTNLTTSNSLRATGSYVNQTGIDETALETMISFDFNNVNTIKFKYGANFDSGTHGNSEERLNCLFFKCYDFNVVEYCPNITINGTPSICPNGSTELTTEVVNTDGTCYLQWESSTDNADWTVMPGATNNSISVTNLTTPTYYRVAIYCDGIPLCGVRYSQRHFVDIDNCTEICDNGLDDDGDGLTDCEDDDCPTPSIDDVQFTDPTNCPDLDNGTITINATSMNDLEYSIDGGTTFQSDGNFTDLLADVYNIVIRDKDSQCEKAYDNNPVTLSDPDCNEICDNNIDDDGDGQVDCNDGDCGKPVIDSVTPSNPNNCPALDNGTITILATGDNLEYSIDNGLSYQDSPNFENLTAATYSIKVRNTVTDCQETTTTTLQNTSCTENCTDGIDNNGDGQIDCEDDACGKPTIIDVDTKIPDNCPSATNGIITITASGANLVYSIDGGNTFQNARIFINLSPGTFNIVVKNNSTGCTDTHTPAVVILEPTCEEICDNNIDDDGDGLTDCEDGDCGNPTISDVVGNDPNNCPILDNGEITITATGANLQYSIDGGVSYHSGNKFINLSAGTYHIQVKNNVTGCTTTYSNNPILLSDPTCEEECDNGIDDDGDGEIDFQDDDCGSGWPQVYVPNSRWLCEGTDYVFEVPVPFPNFTYSWNFGTYASQNSATGPGPHSIQFIPPTGTSAVFPRVIFTAKTTTYSIRDTYDLQVRPTISIANALPITPSDCGATDGSVVIEVNRQVDACFELSLDGGTTWELENQTYFDNLSTGSYSVVARYCDESCISEPSIVTLADPTTTTILGNDEFGDICPNQTYTNTVISNDIVKNLNVIYSIVTPTTHGTIVMDTKGSFEYSTTETYCGMDQFSYSVCDPENICCVTAIATLDLGDKQDPVLQNVPADVTISCDEEIPLPALITAYDNCPSISIDKEEVSTQGLDGCSLHDYTITRSWTARDLCDNTKTEEQVITISDITAPDIFRIYTLPNGKKLIAGVMENVYQEWKTIPFPIQFNQTPLVFTQVVTTKDITPIVTRIRNTSTTQFELKLQEEENGDQSHARESVAWIAIEPGAQTEDYLLETGMLDIDHNWKTVNFSNSYSGAPNFFTSLQTVNENDPSIVRAKSLGATGITCKILEETSKDTEALHELENMAYLAIGVTGNIIDEKGDIIGEVGRISIDHNRVKITPKNKYYNPVIITQSLTNNGDAPIIQRIDLENQASFDIQLQEWDYLDGTHSIEEVSYLIIEGSIPIDASIICAEGTDGLEVGKDIVAVDNCDPNIVLHYEEGKALSGASKQTIRTWYAEDICGNKTAYSQVINCQGMSLQLKAFLQGALVNNNNEDIMRDDLRRLDLLPLEEPYSDFKEYTHVGQGGGEVVDPSLFEQTGDQAIVDWVFVELKKADNFEEVIATKSALIQRDGNVVNVDGNPIISFFDVPNGEYYVKLRHRNHLPLETLYPYTFTSNNIPFIDFTEEFSPLRGNTTRVAVNDQLAAWSGDLNGDNLTVFQGPNNDIFQMFLQILLDELNENTLSNFISRGYTNRDFNMDGTVIFQGPNNDRSVLLWNTIFNHPDNELNQSNFVVSIAEIIKDIDIGSCLLDKTQIFCDFDGDGILNGSDPDDDNDGVSDGNDIAPYNNQSDTDKDGISDNDETGNDGSYHRGTDTDPLSACDPFQDNNICNGADLDGDGFFSNYPLAHSKYDPNDQNSCEPNGVALGCSCPDEDGDGFILICDKNNNEEEGRTISIRVGDWQANQALGNVCGPCTDKTNTPSLPVFDNDNDGYFIGAQPADTDDNNPCIPNTNSFACQQIDRDLDGYFGNADPSSDNYDLDDNNACIPAPTILCYGIDHDGDTYYGNFPQGHPLADPNDNDSCVPDIEKCPIDKDGDGFFDNISPLDTQFDPNDEDNCIPNDANCGGCPTFQGATFICNNPGTSNEATIILEPSEDPTNYANSYCGPCVQFSTIADGEWRDAATWKNGKIPPTSMSGITVSVNHQLTVYENITIGFGGYLWVKDKGLTIKNASLILSGGVFTAINAQIEIDKNVNIDQVSSKFYINNSTLQVKEDYLITNSGVSYFEGACVTVQGDYNITHGIEVYENTNLIVEQGNLSIGQNSTVVFKFTKMKIAGSFNTQGLLTGMETLPALTALSVGGDLINTGLWLCNIENQYCIGGKNEVPEIYLKGMDNCGGIDVFFDEHECP